ncbi:MAG: glycosyltransferase family 39 protein [Candidatus Nanoarchaeia archaeon]|nr:glycosyltransferase family 39 protein [Candidatus Nanoarchaeia archaeon]MDD5358152.1 glycosyltransferase family 39 protein [Candidatus Nanoarchaeia archaeon]MDD5589339.1 glycosyltransferase family 39 protein [Candidatus Nanoarchaeia archaeon]
MEEIKGEIKESSSDTEKKKEELKGKIKTILTNKYNILLFGLLIFSFVLLSYYFFITDGQTLWHDEAEYLSAAKYWAFDIPYEIHPARPPLFSFLAFLIYKIGFQENSIKFLLELIPALLVVLFTYLLVKEMYNKKIALITAFITSVSWIHLFYSMRLMTDTLGLLFGILSLLCFWKGYVQKEKKYLIWLIGFFVALSFLCRLTGILYGGIIFFFLFATEQFKFLKNKHLWIAVLVFILTISPYLIWNQFYHGNVFAFSQGYGDVSNLSPGWYMFQHLYDYPELGFFVFFLIGLTTLFPLFLSLDLTLFKKDKKYYNDLFSFLLVTVILFFFIFFLRVAENRWLIAMSIGIFILSAKGLVLIFDFVKKNFKSLAIIILIVALIFGAYFQLNHADIIIKDKVSSYMPVKEAALWMKDNSNPNDIIMTASVPQTVYYSERKVISFYNSTEGAYYTPEQLGGVINYEKPKYVVVSAFEPSNPQWTLTYPSQYPDIFTPVKVWFEDQAQQTPILIVYETSYN